MKQYDIIVIGAGRASNLAAKAGKLGKKVAIIEKDALGGTCPNKGCVPSKLLIGYAHVARAIKESSRHFIESTINSIDVAKLFEETNKHIATVDSTYNKKFNENVTLYRGKASFVSNKVVTVNGQIFKADLIVLGTGTRPISAPFENAWTSDDIFPLKGKVPKSITIVGAGFIACELANFFSAVGITTKLLVRSDTLLKNEDSFISDIFKEEFSSKVDIDFNTTIKDSNYEDGMFELTLENKDKSISTHTSEALLFATGRTPNTDLLNLQNTDIKVNERGFIKRDKNFQTNVEGVYVVGDASGEHMLQHAAAYEVNHLAKSLFENNDKPLTFKYMPHAVFTDPEIASVGYTQEQIQKTDIPYVTSTTKWIASAKAMSTRLQYPRTKFIINPKTFEILGCHLIGPESSTMIHQILAVMHIDNDIRHLKDMLYVHPALSEALLPAAVRAIQEAKKYKV